MWTGDLAPERNGVVAVGAPIGADAFIAARGAARVEEQSRLLDQLAELGIADNALAMHDGWMLRPVGDMAGEPAAQPVFLSHPASLGVAKRCVEAPTKDAHQPALCPGRLLRFGLRADLAGNHDVVAVAEVICLPIA